MSQLRRKELDEKVFSDLFLKVFTGTDTPGGSSWCAVQVVGRTKYYVRARFLPLICVDDHPLQTTYNVDWKEADALESMSLAERKKYLSGQETKLFTVANDADELDEPCLQSGKLIVFLETHRDRIFTEYRS